MNSSTLQAGPKFSEVFLGLVNANMITTHRWKPPQIDVRSYLWSDGPSNFMEKGKLRVYVERIRLPNTPQEVLPMPLRVTITERLITGFISVESS